MLQLRNNLSQTINTLAPEELHSQHILFNVSTNCILCSVRSCCVHIVGSCVPTPLWEFTNTISTMLRGTAHRQMSLQNILMLICQYDNLLHLSFLS